ncbi:MAG: decarboxylating 6-phosphogluconate dehydrogenase [Burkholderiaceae bacterium]|nr:decarboxylating 6-phosphogluconate dehydrogenase [Burkholderiaceae bacterium]
MNIGMIGMGRMGANMVRRLAQQGHECVVFDSKPDMVEAALQPGVTGTSSLEMLIEKLPHPRIIWLMVPSAVVDEVLVKLENFLNAGDIVIDGGNSFYKDDIRRAAQLGGRHVHYVDVGTSGGTAGVERGYCLMIGGPLRTVQFLDPLFRALAPGLDAASRTPNRHRPESSAELGYFHCGEHGAGHFVKMVHNGIEYGIMGAFAEGLNILSKANIGQRELSSEALHPDAETTPLRTPEHYQYQFDLSEITELWRRGSVISSWLLDLIANALLRDPQLNAFTGHVADSGEGRWTIGAALEEGVPAPILSAALFERFSSRGDADFANKLISAMRFGFGGHSEPVASK